MRVNCVLTSLYSALISLVCLLHFGSVLTKCLPGVLFTVSFVDMMLSVVYVCQETQHQSMKWHFSLLQHIS